MSSSKLKRSFGWMDSAVRFLSAEWLLDRRPNGGTTVFVRALLASVIFFVIAVGISLLFYWNSSCVGFLSQLRSAVLRMLPYAGAVFAFAYTALYARFASQWSYLAGVYNQIMAVKATDSDVDEEAMNNWEAGFIEDALALHLAAKPMFAAVIHSMLIRDGVRVAFVAGVAGGTVKLEAAERCVQEAFGECAFRRND